MSFSPVQDSTSRVYAWGELSASRASAGAAEGTASETGSEQQIAPTDEASFSAEALELSRGSRTRETEPDTDTRAESDSEEESEAKGADGESLTTAEQQQVDKLKARDAEVRAHEAAHMAAGGSHVRGGATYSYQQGPDGKQYAVGGEVGIDVSPVSNNPQATIQKMQQVRAAALAPAEPSGADRAVASKAAQAEAQAREQLAAKNAERVTSAYAGGSEAPKGDLVEATA